jgi:hypothetical protein
MATFEFQVVRTEWYRAAIKIEAADRDDAEIQLSERLGDLDFSLESSLMDHDLLKVDGEDVA